MYNVELDIFQNVQTLDIQQLAIPNLQTSAGKNSLGKTAGYLFWQTWDRFHFRSLDQLFDTTDKPIKRFIENKNADPIPPEGFQGKILSSTINRNIDALADFESGARGSRIEVFNEVTKTYEAYPLTAADKLPVLYQLAFALELLTCNIELVRYGILSPS